MSERYHLSGSVPVAGGGVLMCWTPLAAILAGGAYAFFQHYVRYVYVWVALAIAYPWVVGSLAAFLARRGRVRNVTLTAIVSLVSAFAGYYVMWSVHLWLAFQRQIGFFACLDPWVLWIYAQLGFQEGFWAMERGQQKISGAAVATLWAAEFALLVIGSPLVTMSRLKKSVFCEDCQRWLTWEPLPLALSLDQEGNLRRRLAAGDHELLIDAPQVADLRQPHARIQVACCPECQELIVMSVDEAQASVNKKNEIQFHQKPLVPATRLDYDVGIKVLAQCAPRPEPAVPDAAIPVEPEQPDGTA